MFRCIRSLGALTVVPIVSVSILSAALAQQPPRGRVDNSLGATPAFTPADLLQGPRVRKELALNEEQAQQIEEAFLRLREVQGDFREAQNLTGEDQRKRFAEINKKTVAAKKSVGEKVDQILNPDQRTRLKQLWIQSQGAYALEKSEVAKELGLTQAQQDRIAEILQIVQKHRQKVANPPPGEPGFQDLSQAELKQWRDELGALVEKAEADTLAVLSDEQKDKFAEMKGKEFEFAFRRGSALPVDSKPRQPASD